MMSLAGRAFWIAINSPEAAGESVDQARLEFGDDTPVARLE